VASPRLSARGDAPAPAPAAQPIALLSQQPPSPVPTPLGLGSDLSGSANVPGMGTASGLSPRFMASRADSHTLGSCPVDVVSALCYQSPRATGSTMQAPVPATTTPTAAEPQVLLMSPRAAAAAGSYAQLLSKWADVVQRTSTELRSEAAYFESRASPILSPRRALPLASLAAASAVAAPVITPAELFASIPDAVPAAGSSGAAAGEAGSDTAGDNNSQGRAQSKGGKGDSSSSDTTSDSKPNQTSTSTTAQVLPVADTLMPGSTGVQAANSGTVATTSSATELVSAPSTSPVHTPLPPVSSDDALGSPLSIHHSPHFSGPLATPHPISLLVSAPSGSPALLEVLQPESGPVGSDAVVVKAVSSVTPASGEAANVASPPATTTTGGSAGGAAPLPASAPVANVGTTAAAGPAVASQPGSMGGFGSPAVAQDKVHKQSQQVNQQGTAAGDVQPQSTSAPRLLSPIPLAAVVNFGAVAERQQQDKRAFAGSSKASGTQQVVATKGSQATGIEGAATAAVPQLGAAASTASGARKGAAVQKAAGDSHMPPSAGGITFLSPVQPVARPQRPSNDVKQPARQAAPAGSPAVPDGPKAAVAPAGTATQEATLKLHRAASNPEPLKVPLPNNGSSGGSNNSSVSGGQIVLAAAVMPAGHGRKRSNSAPKLAAGADEAAAATAAGHAGQGRAAAPPAIPAARQASLPFPSTLAQFFGNSDRQGRAPGQVVLLAPVMPAGAARPPPSKQQDSRVVAPNSHNAVAAPNNRTAPGTKAGSSAVAAAGAGSGAAASPTSPATSFSFLTLPSHSGPADTPQGHTPKAFAAAVAHQAPSTSTPSVFSFSLGQQAGRVQGGQPQQELSMAGASTPVLTGSAPLQGMVAQAPGSARSPGSTTSSKQGSPFWHHAFKPWPASPQRPHGAEGTVTSAKGSGGDDAGRGREACDIGKDVGAHTPPAPSPSFAPSPSLAPASPSFAPRGDTKGLAAGSAASAAPSPSFGFVTTATTQGPASPSFGFPVVAGAQATPAASAALPGSDTSVFGNGNIRLQQPTVTSPSFAFQPPPQPAASPAVHSSGQAGQTTTPSATGQSSAVTGGPPQHVTASDTPGATAGTTASDGGSVGTLSKPNAGQVVADPATPSSEASLCTISNHQPDCHHAHHHIPCPSPTLMLSVGSPAGSDTVILGSPSLNFSPAASASAAASSQGAGHECATPDSKASQQQQQRPGGLPSSSSCQGAGEEEGKEESETTSDGTPSAASAKRWLHHQARRASEGGGFGSPAAVAMSETGPPDSLPEVSLQGLPTAARIEEQHAASTAASLTFAAPQRHQDSSSPSSPSFVFPAAPATAGTQAAPMSLLADAPSCSVSFAPRQPTPGPTASSASMVSAATPTLAVGVPASHHNTTPSSPSFAFPVAAAGAEPGSIAAMSATRNPASSDAAPTGAQQSPSFAFPAAPTSSAATVGPMIALPAAQSPSFAFPGPNTAAASTKPGAGTGSAGGDQHVMSPVQGSPSFMFSAPLRTIQQQHQHQQDAPVQQQSSPSFAFPPQQRPTKLQPGQARPEQSGTQQASPSFVLVPPPVTQPTPSGASSGFSDSLQFDDKENQGGHLQSPSFAFAPAAAAAAAGEVVSRPTSLNGSSYPTAGKEAQLPQQHAKNAAADPTSAKHGAPAHAQASSGADPATGEPSPQQSVDGAHSLVQSLSFQVQPRAAAGGIDRKSSSTAETHAVVQITSAAPSLSFQVLVPSATASSGITFQQPKGPSVPAAAAQAHSVADSFAFAPASKPQAEGGGAAGVEGGRGTPTVALFSPPRRAVPTQVNR
jgi:hypothetical protein